MRNYRRWYATRYALWRAYEMKCFYCRQPIDFMDMEVDHVLPRSLSDNPDRLSVLLSDYAIYQYFPDFSIEGITNKVPTHGPSCNLRKGDTIPPKQISFVFLTEIKANLPKVTAELERLSTIAERGQLLGGLAKLLESGQLSVRELERIISEWEFRETLDAPLVVTFGLNVTEAMGMRGFEAVGSSGYATACDRLEAELAEALRSQTDHSFHITEASSRTGETLSVRIVFPELGIDDLDVLPFKYIENYLPWWEILEITNFQQAYGVHYREAIIE